MSRPGNAFRFPVLALGALAPAWLVTTGCVTAPLVAMRAERIRLEVTLDPPTHHLRGRAVLDLRHIPSPSDPSTGPVSVELLLHPSLRITETTVAGVGGSYRRSTRIAGLKRLDRRRSAKAKDNDSPRRHFVVLDELVETCTLFVEYEGELWQDWAASERPGAIHNLTMQAHISQEGVFLAGGPWYPTPPSTDVPTLADFTLIANSIDGMPLVAGAQRDEALSRQTGKLAWRTPFPVDEMVLVGGKHEVHSATHGDVKIELHLKLSQAHVVPDLIRAIHKILDRYEPLLGPYPFAEFKVVDNFFSSGFAFPTFTLLSSTVIDMGNRAFETHGYLDHEILHSWWGNGVFVDPRDGNWCEALASYAANYYGHVLDGDEVQARRVRRNSNHFLSRLTPEEDKPLGTYGLPDGCDRTIAYRKGAMVFHMLARRMGQDAFWRAMQKLNRNYLGRYASWEDIRKVCEQVSGTSLANFFHQWVRLSGAPQLTLEQARYQESNSSLTVDFQIVPSFFELDVPLRLLDASGSHELLVQLDGNNTLLNDPRSADQIMLTETIQTSYTPLSIELDPDHHLFRKVPLGDIVPTTVSTRRGSALAVVTPTGDIPTPYSELADIFQSSYDDQNCIQRVAGNVEVGALAERNTLLLGGAVRDPYISAFLLAIDFPLRFLEDGFEFEGVQYTDPSQAVLCTARHPGVEGGGVTVFVGNNIEAIPPAHRIPFYDHGLVIFENHKPIVRADFEQRNIVTITP